MLQLEVAVQVGVPGVCAQRPPCIPHPTCPPTLCAAVRDLAPPGDLTTQASLPFEFGSVEMQYESYRGAQVGLHENKAQRWSS